LLTAERLEMMYLPSGESLEKGNASGDVRITVLPSAVDPRPPIRSLAAERVRFTFHDNGSRLRTLEGEGKVRVVYQAAAKPEPERSKVDAFETYSQKLRATFREADGTAENVSQSGDFVYRDGERTARSGQSSYDSRTETLVMTESPEVIDANTRTTGRILEYRLKEKTVIVRQDVRSVILPAQQGGGDTPFPAPSGSDAPTVVTAGQMRYWTELSRVEYSGGVHMLSEESQLVARTIDIIDSGSELTAGGDVFHRIARRSGTPQSGKGERLGTAGNRDTRKDSAPVEVRCQKMKYEKGLNSIRYEEKVALESGDLRIWSDHLDAVLDEDGKRIERARAAGGLRINQSGREARGDHADYYFAPGKFVVTGSPAEITDPIRGKSAARRLTFFSSDDRILLEKS
jgi:lipopolysaccharide export system protein LptA